MIDGKTRDKFLSIDKVASLTSLSPSTIRRAVKRGSIEHKLLQLSNRIDKVAMGDVDAEHKADKHCQITNCK